MHDLVTGASGFVGSHLARALVARRGRVRALVRKNPLPDDLLQAGVEPVRGDLADPDTLAVAAAGVERVFHCAARVADWGDPAGFRADNERGVANIVNAARAAGAARFIHLSTTDVYGFPDAGVDETAPCRYRGWPYGDTKIAGENLVWKLGRASGMPVTVIRPANVYGVGSLSFVAEVADRLRRGDMIHLGRRRPPAGLCHVDNLVEAILLAGDSEAAAGQAYNVTDDSNLSWRDFTDGLADALGTGRPRVTLPRSLAYAAGWCLEKASARGHSRRRPLLPRMAVEIFTTDQSFAIGKARRDLGYEPRRTFAASLPEMVRWLEEREP